MNAYQPSLPLAHRYAKSIAQNKSLEPWGTTSSRWRVPQSHLQLGSLRQPPLHKSLLSLRQSTQADDSEPTTRERRTQPFFSQVEQAASPLKPKKLSSFSQ